MSMEALYDNSKAFDMFLRKQGMDGILRKTNLKTRATHAIVPHVRIHTLYAYVIDSLSVIAKQCATACPIRCCSRIYGR